MSLPKDFLDKMKTLLNEEYDAFIASYEQEKISWITFEYIKKQV